MEIQTILPNQPSTIFFTLSAPGAIIGATVSAIVFTSLNTVGEVIAVATGTGIQVSGTILAYGTELTVGTLAANSIRTAARTYSAVATPAISNTSRLGALGISILAGTGAAFTTSAVIYGGKQVSSYLYSCYEDYKQRIARTIQHPIELDTEVLLIEDEIQLIEECPKIIEMSFIESKHCLLDD